LFTHVHSLEKSVFISPTRLTQFAFLAALTLALASCAPERRPSVFALQTQPDARYIFNDRDLEIVFRARADRHFEWRIKNLHIVPLSIAFQDIALRLEGDATRYTLWGQDKESAPAQPPILLEPGKFITLSYPVRFNSPLYPFDKVDAPVRLELRAVWNKRDRDYSIDFPLPTED